MIYLSKILPLFLLPTGITLLLVMAGLVLRRRALCWIGIAVLWIASTPVVSYEITRAAEGWRVRQPIASMPKAHAIVVLSTGRVQPPGDPNASEWTDADRFFGGVELYKAQKAPLLIFTSGWVPWEPDARPEGEVLIRYAADFGIPADRMLTTSRVSNTEEEARAVAALLAKRSSAGVVPPVLLVTSAFHMARAQLLFNRAGVEVVPFPVDFKAAVARGVGPLDFVPSGRSLSRSETALRELYGLAYYRLLKS